MDPRSATKSVAECLEEASSQLQSALERLQSGQTLVDNDDNSDHTNNADADYDPDDLAAAFFAQQAKKRQAESKLPVQEWAKTIFATSEQKHATLVRDGNAPGKGAASMDSRKNDQAVELLKADDLWKEFYSAYSEL